MPEHKIMCPPNMSGEIVKVYGDAADKMDSCKINDTVLEVRVYIYIYIFMCV